MGAASYAAGAAFFLVTTGATALTATLLVRRLPRLAGASRLLAWGLLWTFALVAVHMLPGVLGVLNRWTVAAAAVLGLIGTARAFRGRERPTAEEVAPAHRHDGPLHARVLAALGAAAIAALVVGYYRGEVTHSVSSDDMLNFHLPLVSSWIQGQSFWPVVDLLPYDTTGNYPQNGDVLVLASMLPWRGDAFARLAVLPYIALTGLATYALGRELRADRARALLMACVVVATPILLLAGVVSGLPDVVMYGTFGGGLVFLIRCIRTRGTSDALLAGVGLGLAFGTKWYAVPAVVAMLVLFGAAVLVSRSERRSGLRLLVVACLSVAVAGGFWLVRNAVRSGSPFFPAGWLPLGARSDVGNPGPRTDFPLGHYLFDGRVLRHVVLPDELKAFGVGGLLLLLGALAAALWAARSARDERADVGMRTILWTVAAALVLALIYIVTPNTASGFEGQPVLVYYSARYLVPAAIPAAAALAWVATRAGRAGVAIDVLAVVAIADGLRRAFDLPLADMAAGAAVVAALAAAAWATARAARTRARWLGFAAGGLAALIAVGGYAVRHGHYPSVYARDTDAPVGGYAVQHRYADHRLRGEDAAVDYFLDHGRNGDRVGLAEQWSVLPPSPVFAMFGARLRNHVRYVGEHEDGVNKPYRDRARFVAALGRGGNAWLMVGRGVRGGVTTSAMKWAPAAGYVEVARTARLALYRRSVGP